MYRCEVSGNISQSNFKFGNTRNVQCVCISVAMCAYVENISRNNFSPQIIDRIIEAGDVYYKCTKLLLGPNHREVFLNPDEVAAHLSLFNHTYNVSTEFVFAGLFPSTSRNVRESVRVLQQELVASFNASGDSGFIFLGLHAAISFWKSANQYHVFDSHSVDEMGFNNASGVGRIFTFRNLEALAQFLSKKGPLDGRMIQYEVSRVTTSPSNHLLPRNGQLTAITSFNSSTLPAAASSQLMSSDWKLNTETRVILEDISDLLKSTSNTEEGKSNPRKRDRSEEIVGEKEEESCNVLIEENPGPLRKVGRPKKKKRGRPKTSDLSAEDQHRVAADKYQINHPEVHRKAVDRYCNDHPDVNKKAVDKYKKNHPEATNASNKDYKIRNPGLHIPAAIRKGGLIGERSGKELELITSYRLKNANLHSEKTYRCVFCNARLFEEERKKKKWCCGQGKNKIMSFPPLPNTIYNDRRFQEHPRRYNDLFSFCALSVPQGYHHPPGFAFMKIQGRVYHLVYDLNCHGINNSYLYIDDGSARIAEGKRRKLNPDVTARLQSFLESCNPFVGLYKKLSDEPSENARLEFEVTSRQKHGPVLGDRPISAEVSALLNCDGSDPPPQKFCLWKKGSPSPRIIDFTSCLVEPLQYPLLYPEGQLGWSYTRVDNGKPPRKVSILKYTRCLLLSEDRFSRFGPLSETWLIDMYARIEGQRLRFLQMSQKKAQEQGGLRSGPLDEVSVAIHTDETINGGAEEERVVPGRVFLPCSFTGGPRYMKVCYMDAMAIVSRLGGPTYFLTFTACGGWEEIKASKYPGSKQDAQIVNRVFELKKKELIRDLKSGKFFGNLAYIIWVIEFQMRGLPHAHICFRVADGGPKQNIEIDRFIRADIPSTEEAGGRLRNLVLKHMLHGPCGPPHRTDLPCWDAKAQKCNKFFPKANVETTYTDERGFVQYKRNSNNKASIHYRKEIVEVDDRWIVPYNAALLLKYQCHINLEIASARRVVKYLFKYISKGQSHRRMTVVGEEQNLDEVEDFVTKRHIGATDAAWRVLEFHLTARNPPVISLPVHLKGKHNVIFVPGKEQEACHKATSLLLIYFGRPEIPDLDDMTYQDFYERYRVLTKSPKGTLNPIPHPDGRHYVMRRKKCECIARLFWVTPSRGEQYYLRILLSRYPCRGYNDLYALGGPDCQSFQMAAKALGLADDKKEYIEALEEASKFMCATRLRNFFVLLTTIGAPSPEMWESLKSKLCEDFIEMFPEDEEKALKMGLIHIDRCLRRHGSSLQEAGLPVVDDDSTELGRERLTYSISLQKAYVDDWEPRLSADQRKVFDYVKGVTTAGNTRNVIFVDGPGGTGKTQLLRVISAYFRSESRVVLCVASSGIAAQNLSGGSTAHSMFRIPLDLQNNSYWSITNGTQRAELIREASLIIFDEAPMAHKNAIEMLDRSLRDLMHKDDLFGGKLIIFSGDFRQIPPVVENARTTADVVQASVLKSYVWKSVTKFPLTTAHRMAGEEEYSNFLLNIGNNTVEHLTIGEGKDAETFVALPHIKHVKTLGELIDFVFPADILQRPDECAKRVIISTLNRNVNEVNSIVLRMLEGKVESFYSLDSVADSDAADVDVDESLLHHAQGKGVPEHVLNLKIGCVCIVTRNLNFDLGLVNGTKVIIVGMSRRLITCRKPDSNEIFGIPRITFKFPMFSRSPIDVCRRQFPLQICYGTTVHKSQGQTIGIVGLDLRSDCFTHGQLYVGLSRVRSPNNIRVLVPPERIINGVPHAKNVVYKDLM